MAIEVLNVRITAETEFVFTKAQSPQENTVVEELRTLKIRDRDIDMVDSNYFDHGMARDWQG